MKILVVEDHPGLLRTVGEALTAEGYVCTLASTAADAGEKVYLYAYDLAIVDINLPDGSGLDVIRQIREHQPRMGVIVISARGSTQQKVEGLELGADDYLAKPFDMAELIARIKALLRRRVFAGEEILSAGDIELSAEKRTVKVRDIPLELTKSEFDILLYFLSNPTRVLTRESIAEHIWGDNMDLADSFDFIYSHIKNLRKKIIACGVPDPIKAVYGIGYKLDIS